MLLKLAGPHLSILGPHSNGALLGRISRRDDLPLHQRSSEILLVDDADARLPEGFRAVLVRHGSVASPPLDTYRLGSEFAYLSEGDIVRIEPARRSITVLYRRNSRSNSLLVTERCDNYCVMCSQPPKVGDDSHLVDELLATIPLMCSDTAELGITGGEPGLLGDKLIRIIESLGRNLPNTAVHVLSNGRSFADIELARRFAAVRHPRLMVGIPLYSALPEEHDYVVQARGAFDETVRGLVNLKRFLVAVELRFVIHRETVRGLSEFAEFVTRNLAFVDHVALMGLEPVGFARANLDALWIDPIDYQDELVRAVGILERGGLAVSIYNHQLCTISPTLHRFARASISDWKNRYFDECESCAKCGDCGGFFASATARRSRGIHPL
jgi:His-Xaa-Ser system radical SAM maturase HxsC